MLEFQFLETIYYLISHFIKSAPHFSLTVLEATLAAKRRAACRRFGPGGPGGAGCPERGKRGATQLQPRQTTATSFYIFTHTNFYIFVWQRVCEYISQGVNSKDISQERDWRQ